MDEASAPAIEALAAAEASDRALRNSHIHLAAGVMVVLGLVAALYLARAFFVPLLIGILASYALHPVVDALERARLPRSLGAALVLLTVVGSFSWIGFAISDDVQAMIEKLPEAARKLRHELSEARSTGAPSALQNMQDAAHEIEGAATEAGGKAAKPAGRAMAAPAAEASWLHDYTLAQSALLVTVAAQTPIVLLLTYFLLASGPHFRRKLVQLVGPSLSAKKEAVGILDEIDVQVQRFLFAVLASNALLGLATWLAFFALGMEHAGAWGATAG